MTNLISLALEGVSYLLPDGRPLFSDLHELFDRRRTGLVGRNGVGKSVLARILAGELIPSSGRCARSGSIYYLPQQISIGAQQTVAALAGVQDIIDALERIEHGSTSVQDFERVGERWDIRQQLQQQLTQHRLDRLRAQTPAAQLSGGEAMRVALLGAWLSRADFLILDEPTNHLDRENRRALQQQLQQWPNGLIAISHDRELLENMQRIVELSTLGLRSYGGGYSFYAQTKAQQQTSAATQLQQRKAEQRRERRQLIEQRENLQQRQARGKKQAGEANQARILLGRQKERAEVFGGKIKAQQQTKLDDLAQRVRAAAQRVEEQTAIVLYNPGDDATAPKKIAELDGVVMPHIAGPTRSVNLSLNKTQRIALTGPNGCGKSTLLQALAGLLAPQAGTCEVFVRAAYLDQQLSALDPGLSTLEQVLAVNSTLGETGVRTRLAQLGLDAQRILLPTHLLSGGERLKSALAYVLYSDSPAQLLLLDEPSNHLDLISMQALESMLRQYNGALIVASHDEVFLNNLALTHRLNATPNGWLLQEVAPHALES